MKSVVDSNNSFYEGVGFWPGGREPPVAELHIAELIPTPDGVRSGFDLDIIAPNSL